LSGTVLLAETKLGSENTVECWKTLTQSWPCLEGKQTNSPENGLSTESSSSCLWRM